MTCGMKEGYNVCDMIDAVNSIANGGGSLRGMDEITGIASEVYGASSGQRRGSFTALLLRAQDSLTRFTA